MRFLLIASGGFLGLGETTFMIPVDAVTSVEDDLVRIDQTRERVAGAPRYDPSLVMKQDHWSDVYGYYGYTPFWMGGYAYPPFPYYPPR